MNLIDADSLRGIIQAIEWENADIAEGLILADCAILDQPTVDAVPVIRCRDCKYNSNTDGNYVKCNIIPQMFGKTPDDNYCSWAERKEE